MHRKYLNERGIALITTLMMLVLGFAVVVTLMTMVTQGTKITGVEQRYTTALDASKGGAEFLIHMIRNNVFIPPTDIIPSASGGSCLQTKMTTEHSGTNWSGTGCSVTSDIKSQPDMTMSLSGYQVYVKILDSRVGKCDPAEPDLCDYITVAVRSQETAGAREHAEVTFLYRVEE